MSSQQPDNRNPMLSGVRKITLGLSSAWDILWDAIVNYRANGNTNQAAAIAMYAILSIIPLFILTLVLASRIFSSSTNVQSELMEMIQGLVPYFTGDLVAQLGQMERKKQVLGWVGIIGLIWFSSTIFNAIETALNMSFRSTRTRNYAVSKLMAISMIPLGWSVGIASIGITYVSTILAKQPLLAESNLYIMPLHDVLFRYGIPYLLTVLFSTAVYWGIPTGKVSLSGAFVGGMIFSTLMEVAKHFFTWYVANYTRYNVIYGSLEALVILVIWVFYVALIFLFCAELISSYQRRDMILIEKAILRPGRSSFHIDERLFRRFGRFYPEGARIFKEGDTGSDIYYILSGRVQVEKEAGQVKKLLAVMGPGEYFGEMAALIDAPRTASALAAEDSDVAVVSGDAFRHVLRESGEVSLFMLKEFSRRIRLTNLKLEELTQSWIRLVAILYLLEQWPLQANQNPVAELAKFTGKEQEEIQDVLRDLGTRGILSVQEDRITGFAREQAWALAREQIVA